MNQASSLQGIASILEVLDTMIEMLDDSARSYQKMALETRPNGAKAILNWFYYIETIRLRRFVDRRRTLLKRHPELSGNGYRPRSGTGISKIGEVDGLLKTADPLRILRFAIDNELRAMQFFRRKAAHTTDPAKRQMYSAAIKEQEYQIARLSTKRQELMQRQINRGAEELDGILA
jgi:rubrerythrin